MENLEKIDDIILEEETEPTEVMEETDVTPVAETEEVAPYGDYGPSYYMAPTVEEVMRNKKGKKKSIVLD